MDLDQGLVASAADMRLQMKVLVEFLGADSPSHQDVCGQVLSGQLKIKAEEGAGTVALGEGVVNYEIGPLGEIRRAALLAGDLPMLPGVWRASPIRSPGKRYRYAMNPPSWLRSSCWAGPA